MQENIHIGIISNIEQQLTLQLTLSDGQILMSTLVYAKCSAQERLQLWETIYSVGYNLNLPWLVGGDSNVVLSDEDKIGCLLIYSHDYEDISVCINSCELFDSDVKESPFMWWNGRINNACKFKEVG